MEPQDAAAGFSDLPEDILVSLCSYLTSNGATYFSLTCRAHLELLNSRRLWQELASRQLRLNDDRMQFPLTHTPFSN